MKIENAIGKPCPIAEWFDGEEGEIIPFKGPKKFEYIKGMENPKTQMEAMLKMIDDAIDLSWESLFPGEDKSRKEDLSIGFCINLLNPITQANGLGKVFDVKKAQEVLKEGGKTSHSQESPTSENVQPTTK